MKQKWIELQREIDKSITTVEDFNITLTIIDGISRQKVNKNIKDFYNTIKQFDLIDLYKILYSTMTGYILFSTTHRTFTKIDYTKSQ